MFFILTIIIISTGFKKKNRKIVKHLACPEAIDLISKCLRFDHTERITAAEALKHPYFDPVREIE